MTNEAKAAATDREELVTCPKHPHVWLRCPACIGQRGGSASSDRKTRAARKNGKKGGRPPKVQGMEDRSAVMTVTEAILMTHEQREGLTVEQLRGIAYGIRNYSPQSANEWPGLRHLKSLLDVLPPDPAATPRARTLTLASCGHRTAILMSTASGSSCPDCYDQMEGND